MATNSSERATLSPDGAPASAGPEAQATYTYDPTGRLHTVGGGNADSPSSFTYTYEPNSHLLKTVTGLAHTVTNTWDATRDALLVKENKAGGNVISRYDYSVNEIGQRTGVATSGSAFAARPTIGWAYNARGEVISAAHSDNAKSRFYDYDPIGNRRKSRTGTATDSGGELTTYVSNPLNQYTAVSTVSPSYDADGNQLQGPLPADPSKTAGYLWDSENRLLEASSDGTTVASYRYDPFGRRIAKTASGTTTLFLYDGWNLIAEYSRSAGVPPTISRTHLWGSDLSGTFQGAGGVGGLLTTTSHGRTSKESFHPLYDGNGNVSDYVNESGTIAAHFEYDPFGKLTVNTDSSGQFPIRFSTKFVDIKTGLNYYGYRYYNSQQGRWLNRDLIKERGGYNLSAFVRNRPIGSVDVLGLKINYDDSRCPKGCVDDEKKKFDDALEKLGEGGPLGRAMVDLVKSPEYTLNVRLCFGGGPTGGNINDGEGSVGLPSDKGPGWTDPERLAKAIKDGDFHEEDKDKIGEIVLGHELGHAIFGFDDPGVVDAVENPLRGEMGKKPRGVYTGEDGIKPDAGEKEKAGKIIDKYKNNYPAFEKIRDTFNK